MIKVLLQIMVVRRKREKRRCGKTGTRRSGGGHDTGRKDKLANNEDKESWARKLGKCFWSIHHK